MRFVSARAMSLAVSRSPRSISQRIVSFTCVAMLATRSRRHAVTNASARSVLKTSSASVKSGSASSTMQPSDSNDVALRVHDLR